MLQSMAMFDCGKFDSGLEIQQWPWPFSSVEISTLYRFKFLKLWPVKVADKQRRNQTDKNKHTFFDLGDINCKEQSQNT